MAALPSQQVCDGAQQAGQVRCHHRPGSARRECFRPHRPAAGAGRRWRAGSSPTAAPSQTPGRCGTARRRRCRAPSRPLRAPTAAAAQRGCAACAAAPRRPRARQALPGRSIRSAGTSCRPRLNTAARAAEPWAAGAGLRVPRGAVPPPGCRWQARDRRADGPHGGTAAAPEPGGRGGAPIARPEPWGERSAPRTPPPTPPRRGLPPHPPRPLPPSPASPPGRRDAAREAPAPRPPVCQSRQGATARCPRPEDQAAAPPPQ
eukprot:scaffold12123_cov128-Isochrysis_galbana.AAC.1